MDSPNPSMTEGFRQINEILDEAICAAKSVLRPSSNITQILTVERVCAAIKLRKRGAGDMPLSEVIGASHE